MRTRRFDTRAGSIELAIPKLRRGSWFPDWLAEPPPRAERALVQVVCQCCVEGVSTRAVDDVVRALGVQGLSKSQVSEMAKALDETVAAFRSWPLDGGPYAYLWLDALTQRVREGGRVVNVAVVVATGADAGAAVWIPGFEVTATADGVGWTAFLRDPLARGPSGVLPGVSDDHRGLFRPPHGGGSSGS
jgi:transposase-like protein